MIEQQTELAQRQADLAAQRLEAEVRRPADAEAYKQRTLADANRDRVKAEAEAEAFRQRTVAESGRYAAALNAEGNAKATRLMGEASAAAAKSTADGEAYARRAVADADAAAIQARAEALAGENQQLIAANKLVEMMPQLVAAAAEGLSGANLTVLNGSSGVTETVTNLVAQGMAVYDSLRASATREIEGPSGSKD